jgi:hypothetical protein
MTFRELRDLVNLSDKYIPEYEKDKIMVRVVLDEIGLGPHVTSNIRSANRGIDWDHNSFLLWTEDKICRKKNDG